MTDEEYSEINTRVNRMIGQLTVPMMKFRDPDIKEVHSHLLELAQCLKEDARAGGGYGAGVLWTVLQRKAKEYFEAQRKQADGVTGD